MHFSPKMWKEGQDEKRKLKSDAIPTVFGYFLKKNSKPDEATTKLIKDAKEDQVSINRCMNIIKRQIYIFTLIDILLTSYRVLICYYQTKKV